MKSKVLNSVGALASQITVTALLLAMVSSFSYGAYVLLGIGIHSAEPYICKAVFCYNGLLVEIDHGTVNIFNALLVFAFVPVIFDFSELLLNYIVNIFLKILSSMKVFMPIRFAIGQ
jgi:uncharacterized integral membrane protein